MASEFMADDRRAVGPVYTQFRKMGVHSLSGRVVRTLALIVCWTSLPISQAQDLSETKSILESALTGQGQFSWVQTTTDAAGNKLGSVNVSSRVADSRVDTQSCVFAFRLERNFPDYRIHIAWTVPFAEIDRVEVSPLAEYANKTSASQGHAENVLSTDIPVVLVRIHAARDRKFAAHRWSVNSEKQVVERDEQSSPALLVFNRDETAQRVTDALLRARDHCRRRE